MFSVLNAASDRDITCLLLKDTPADYSVVKYCSNNRIIMVRRNWNWLCHINSNVLRPSTPIFDYLLVGIYSISDN